MRRLLAHQDFGNIMTLGNNNEDDHEDGNSAPFDESMKSMMIEPILGAGEQVVTEQEAAGGEDMEESEEDIDIVL